MQDVQLTTLPNGIRVISDANHAVESVALGLWIDAGTRDENKGLNGIAHMTEHMLFKGTAQRTAQEISGEIEAVGGDLNAYTSREVTSYHARVLQQDLNLAFDILADMFRNHTFPEDEIERERAVIIQEIGMYRDIPDDLIFDNFYEAAFQNQKLGAPVLGNIDALARIGRSDLLDYAASLYGAENLIISAAGQIDHDEIVNLAGEYFADVKGAEKAMNDPAYFTPQEHFQTKDLGQTHIILGFSAEPRTSARFYTQQALSALMGEGMSSRLFQEIREKRGLAYSVYSFCSAYKDAGLLGIYAGTAPERSPEYMKYVVDEIDKIQNEDIGEDEVMRVKAQLRAGLLMSCESMITRANRQAKHVIYNDDIFETQEVVDHIDAITPRDIQNLAREIFSGDFSLAALGNLDHMPAAKSLPLHRAA